MVCVLSASQRPDLHAYIWPRPCCCFMVGEKEVDALSQIQIQVY